MTGSAQALRQKVAIRNQTGLNIGRWDRYDMALAEALDWPLEETTLDPDIKAELRRVGIETAGQAAMHRLLNSRDERIVAKMVAIVASRMPKTVLTHSTTADLGEMDTGALLSALGFEAAEIVDDLIETPEKGVNSPETGSNPEAQLMGEGPVGSGKGQDDQPT
jgi:hypothetical protein